MKIAVFSMDIEDWYHLDYFRSIIKNKEYSLLDGVNNYLELIESYQIPSSFFVLEEIANSQKKLIQDLSNKKYDIGSHGDDHTRPMEIKLSDFKESTFKTKNNLEDIIGKEVIGYRAPCFSLDRDRLDIIKDNGFKYDSSKIDFSIHPLYGNLDLSDYKKIEKSIYRKDSFFEFENSTTRILNKTIPISGGGYLRILPWMLSEYLFKSYFKKGNLFTLYVHPFEFSSKSNPDFNNDINYLKRFRFSRGRKTMNKKLKSLIQILKDSGYVFMDFCSLRKKITSKVIDL